MELKSKAESNLQEIFQNYLWWEFSFLSFFFFLLNNTYHYQQVTCTRKLETKKLMFILFGLCCQREVKANACALVDQQGCPLALDRWLVLIPTFLRTSWSCPVVPGPPRLPSLIKMTTGVEQNYSSMCTVEVHRQETLVIVMNWRMWTDLGAETSSWPLSAQLCRRPDI